MPASQDSPANQTLPRNSGWDICRDCIDPIVHGLQAILLRWNRPRLEPPLPQEIAWLYNDCHLESAITGLKIYRSVEFAQDFEARLREPLREFQELEFRACQILSGDLEGSSTEVVWQRDAIQKLLEREYFLIRAAGGREYGENAYDSVLEAEPRRQLIEEIEKQWGGLQNTFRDLVTYLKDVSALLRAKPIQLQAGTTGQGERPGAPASVAKAATPPLESEVQPKAASKRVALFGPGEQPKIDGKHKPPLSTAAYDVVCSLIQAGDNGLTKDQLDAKSRHGDARKIMKRLADSDRDWKSVLLFPGKPGRGYRIR